MAQPALLPFFAEIPVLAGAVPSLLDFAERTAGALQTAFAAANVGFWVNVEGEWAPLSVSGRRELHPPHWEMTQAQDTDLPVHHGSWTLMAVGGRDARQILVIHSEPRGDMTIPWNLLQRALGGGLHIVYERARMDRLAALQGAIRRGHENLAQTPGAVAQDLEVVAAKIYGAQSCKLYEWHHQELHLPGNSTQTVSADVMARARKALKSREPDFLPEPPSPGKTVTRILMLPLLFSEGPVVGLLEMNFGPPQAPDPVVDENELAEVSHLLADALRRSSTGQPGSGTSPAVDAADMSAVVPNRNPRLLGQSQAIQHVTQRISRVAPTDLCVLILGENGTGKEVVAKMIHDASLRRHETFLGVNCAAMSESLLESELFGHEKGAFTDASDTRPGKFEVADRGTLLLDEVGELSLRAQAKLLRVLEDKTVVRVGGVQSIRTDARILAATNRDLTAMVREHTFREDLFFRLNVVAIELPPLRDRGEDILLLAKAFFEELARRVGRQPLELSPAAERAMLAYTWPGNVRELRNLVERLTFLHPHRVIDAKDLPLHAAAPESTFAMHPDLDLSEATRLFQIELIQLQIAAAGNNVTEAARRLGMHRTNLYRKMAQLRMAAPKE